ncbi:MAG TPA: hypothetical protein VKA64_11375, partial [Gammaproteobacteria bacterium]|nr:hypothetical protein [Gammaproteobacteria bacterium]
MLRSMAGIILALVPLAVPAEEGYEIKAAVDDETFIINDEAFEAVSYCLGWEEGEKVRFVEGNAQGSCVS